MEWKTDNGPKAAQLWWLYAAAALVLVAGLFAFSMLGGRASSTSDSTGPDMQKILSGDVAVKTHLLAKRFPSVAGKQDQNSLEIALDAYVTAAARPSPAAYRRAGILSEVLGNPDAETYFDKLHSKEITKLAPDRISKADAAELRSEAAMWRNIYSADKLDRGTAERYAARIKKVSTGPMGAYALQRVYALAGMKTLAQQTMNEAGDRAGVSMMSIGALVIAILLAGLAGLVFIGLFVSRSGRWKVASSTPAAPEAEVLDVPESAAESGPRSIPSQVLLQAFIFYLLAVVVVEIGLASLVIPSIRKLSMETRLLDTVLLEFSTVAVSGVLALVVLVALARRSGGSLESIGLTTRNFGANAVAGIVGACCLVPMLIIAALVSSFIFRGSPAREHPIIPMLLSGNSAVFGLLLIVGAVFAPFFEEIFFRGVLYNGLKAKMGVPLGIIVSASVFSILHPQLPTGFLPIFVIGALFAGLVETRRSLVPSMIAHALNNGAIFLIMYLAFFQ